MFWSDCELVSRTLARLCSAEWLRSVIIPRRGCEGSEQVRVRMTVVSVCVCRSSMCQEKSVDSRVTEEKTGRS